MVYHLKEKRGTSRVRLRAPIRCQVRGQASFGNALSDDISAGGISFTADNPIPISTPVMLEINILSRVIRLVGEIAWSQSLPHSDRKRLGIKFLEVEPAQKDYLLDFINMRTGKEKITYVSRANQG